MSLSFDSGSQQNIGLGSIGNDPNLNNNILFVIHYYTKQNSFC